MAIAENAAIEFFGTKDDLDSSGVAVASNAFSVASDLVQWTNDDDAPAAAVTLVMEVDVAAADNSGCNMYFRKMNVDGTDDDEIPSATHRIGWVAFFPAVNGTTALQRNTQRIVLPNYKSSSVYEVYIENKTGQAITTSTWTVFITPIAIGPHPA